MARKEIILSTDTFGTMVSKTNTTAMRLGDLDSLNTSLDSVPVDSDMVQVINSIYDSLGPSTLALNTLSQVIKEAINELHDSINGLTDSLNEAYNRIALLDSDTLAFNDSLHVGALSFDSHGIGVGESPYDADIALNLHDGYGATEGTRFGRFERYQDSDLKISGGDAGTTAIIIADSSVTVEGNTVIKGDLQVIGDAGVNFETNDNIVVLNAEYEGATPTDNIGIQGNRDTHPAGDALIQWNEVDSYWEAGVTTDMARLLRLNDSHTIPFDMLTELTQHSVLGGDSDVEPINIAANRVLGRDSALGQFDGRLGGIQLTNAHIRDSAAIANTKLENFHVRINNVRVDLGGEGTIDIAGSLDSLGELPGVITAGAGRTYNNYSPISTYANDDSSQAIIVGHHPAMYNPANPNLPARSVLIGWHAGSTPDQDVDNDGQLHNVAVGYLAGYNNDARQITAIGAEALGSAGLTTGDNHVAVGYQALFDVAGSSHNTAVGTQAGKNITTGSSNVAIGYNSGPLAAGGSASQNTYIGTSAGNDATTGTNNTLLGYDAQKSGATVSNEMTFGSTNVTKWRFPGVSLECTNKTFIYASNGTTVLRTFLTGDA